MHHDHISFIGAGRVGTSLCHEIFNAGYTVDLIVSEKENNGTALARSCNAQWSSQPDFTPLTKIIFVAVPDHKLQSILASIKCNEDTVVAHTAGSYGLDIFPDSIKHRGVFYPLQTFSKNRNVNFREIPLLLESSGEISSLTLNRIAMALSAKVYFIDTKRRRMLHLAAVFVNNFANHMLVQGKEIALKAGLPFEILTPLIQETISKALEAGPENSQTGPAVRNDKNTIEKHLELLSFSPELRIIYETLTNSIINNRKL